MIVAQLSSPNDERHTLVIGIEAQNVRELMNARPIHRSLDELVPALAGWDLTIVTGEDYDRFLAWAKSKGVVPKEFT